MRSMKIFVLLCFVVALIGCKLTIIAFDAPDTAETGTVITVTITEKAEDLDDGATDHGVVLQIPNGWSVLSATIGTSSDYQSLLRENTSISTLYTAETGYKIWAGSNGLVSSYPGQTYSPVAIIKLVVADFPGNVGDTQSYTLKAVVGATRGSVWVADDPVDEFDFTTIIMEPYIEEIIVTKVDDTTAPDPISSLLASVDYNYADDPYVKLSWESYNEALQGDVVKYRVYRSTSSFTDITGMSPIIEGYIVKTIFPDLVYPKSYEDTGVSPGNTYFYAVTAIDELDNENPNVTSFSILVPERISIKGTVYINNQPVIGEGVVIKAYTSCDDEDTITYTSIDYSTGTYEIKVPVGISYYLLAEANNPSNFIPEWWANPASVRDCSNAQTIPANSGEDVTGIDFQLETGGTISGQVFQGDGTTPIANYASVSVFTTDPCGNYVYLTSVGVDNNGAYKITGLPNGTYFLIARSYDTNLVSEFWANPESTPYCSNAQSFQVVEGQDFTEKNFQLDQGTSISGTVFHSDGVTPLTGPFWGVVKAYIGNPCDPGFSYQNLSYFHTTGAYQITGLPMGTYYLIASIINSSTLYTSEWWGLPESSPECSQAMQVVVNSQGQVIVNKDFQLDPLFYDSDSDGMDDNWEKKYFGSLGRDGTGDFDQDGINDLEEYKNGTNPADEPSASVTQVPTLSEWGVILLLFFSGLYAVWILRRRGLAS